MSKLESLDKSLIIKKVDKETVNIRLNNNDLLISIVGQFNQNLKELEKLTKTNIYSRGNSITAKGKSSDIEEFSKAISSYYKSMKDNKDIQEKQVLRYNRRIKSIIEKDILSQFWNEERISLLDGVDKTAIKTKSPYELVDEIKGKNE